MRDAPNPRRSSAPPSIYASAEDVELNFRDRTFVLGDNNEIAEVRPLDWRKDKFLKLPFWFGVNILVPGVMAPKEGDFYVISEATLEKPLDTPGEWMIEAGSSLVKQETVFVTTRTQYLDAGKNPADHRAIHGQARIQARRRQDGADPSAARGFAADEVDARRTYPGDLREIPHMRTIVVAIALTLISIVAGCTPDKALDFGPTGEISTPPEDQMSRDIMRDFAGRDFILADNDHEAHVSLSDWKPGRGIVMPYWLGVNPLYPGFLRPTVGHLYVMSQSTLVRPLSNNEYLIRAGSKLFKSDTIFEATHTHYTDTGGMLPTVVRFVGTRVITVPKDAPATGTITEKVPVLREVSMPMHTTPDQDLTGYAKFEAVKSSNFPSF